MTFRIGGPSNEDGQPIDQIGTQVGGKGVDGNFHIFSTDNSGNLNVNATIGGGGNTAVNLTQVGGAAIAEGQTTSVNSLPVVIASDQTPIEISARAALTNPVDATDGSRVTVMADKAGRLVVTNGHVRDLVASQQTTFATAAETTIITAGAAGIFNDLCQLIITTTAAAAQTITIKDATAGTTRLVLDYPNTAAANLSTPCVINFEPPIPQAVAANNWTATTSLATGTKITAVYIKNL
jgi:hypothetical protein